ncbi:MAG TPA: hypothetical protein DCM38_10330 [Gammaproteobacteria bacterium]|nr:hypothetical protein [Gammaproteobacteria bacterium]
MALIDNQGEPISRWWVMKSIEVLEKQKNLFSSAQMRQARVELIAGANRLKTIKSWLLAAQIIEGCGREHVITDFGKAIIANDPHLEKASTWWAFHLSICFSKRKEPYARFFISLEPIAKDWMPWEKIIKQVRAKAELQNYEKKVIEYCLSGIRRMFVGDRPLAELGLIESRKVRGQGIYVRLGEPLVSDEVIRHALALMRFHHFRNRISVDFSELLNAGLDRFLCLSPDTLRTKLRGISRMERWQNELSFTEAANLDSIAFGENLIPKKTLLVLLQESQDTWL